MGKMLVTISATDLFEGCVPSITSSTLLVTGTVEIHALATQSLSLFLANQINGNLVHLKRL
jgi:hypothetical protein